MTWRRGVVFGFDTETTGVDVFEDRIVTATVVKIVDGKLEDKRTWLIDPGVEIPEGATAVHGITTEHARDHGVHPLEALGGDGGIGDTVVRVLRSRTPLVVFNAAFDLSLLEGELTRWGLPRLTAELTPDQWRTVIDPHVMARGIAKDNATAGDRREWANLKAGMLKLPALCKRFGVPFEETHDATADAAGAALLACAICETYNAIGSLAPGELHAKQAAWHQAAMVGLREWAAKQGKSDQYADVDEGWPIHSRLTAAAEVQA